jgi:hypothetical protein
MKPGQLSTKLGRRHIEWQMKFSNQPRAALLTDGLSWWLNNSTTS